MDNKKTVFNPYLVLALGVTGISFSALLARMTAAPPAIIAFWRLVFTCLLLSPLALRDRLEFKTVSRRDFLLSLLSGLFLCLHFVFWFASLPRTTVSSATLLVNIHPLVVVTVGWLGKEKVRLQALPWAGVALAGIALLGASGLRVAGALTGNILAAAGGLMIAGYYLMGRLVRPRVSIGIYSFLVYSSSALLLLAVNLAANNPFFGYRATDWLVFAALAAVPTICGHTLINWSLKYLPAGVISVSALGEPVIATILAIPLLSEIPGSLQLAGGLLVVLGIAIFQIKSRK
ncbi:MAG: DMT family transporter [Firmicutes bacterium]|nr:DMT family transporter [Bacillota bacterium]